jgi:gliding motility-associated-like protein
MLLPPKQITTLFLLLILFQSAIAGIDPRLVENKGQWHEEVHFKALTNGGYFFIGENGVTVQQLEQGFFDHFHDWIQGNSDEPIGNTHTLKFDFVGGNFNDFHGEENLSRTDNFFIGNDPSKHAKGVQSFQRAYYSNVYPNIDLRFDIKSDRLKYEFLVSPNADPSQIHVSINNSESIKLKDGRLIFKTSVGAIYEEQPFVYQLDENGRVKRVECNYLLEGNLVSYEFPEGYDTNRELIIDPEISFSTYVGAFSDNFGFTASYDSDGDLYGGAIVFGGGYPVAGGPFQINFAGGVIDCGITKFSSDGTELLYSTFLGGSDNEAPHSLVVNENNELFIYGTTGSFDFPTTPGAAQENFSGGPTLTGLGVSYLQGADIFVAKISADGTDLIAATYIGGTGNDGLNFSPALEFNFGDRFRGEIIVGDQGRVYVASVTQSTDFPFTNGFSGAYNGVSSGTIFNLSGDLTQLIWSSATGGDVAEAAFGVQIGPDGTIYITGGTTSVNLISSATGADPSYSGMVDGYIMRLSANGSTVLNSTYVGTFGFDQTYFVQLDTDGEVYVIGQSLGDIQVSPDVYSNPGGRQFVQKYSADLTTLEWSTTIGSNDNQINFSPSAFLVTNCSDIYVSGWGGSTNNFGQAGGTTFGLPTTPDAYQSSTDGSDFYLMVLSEDAQDLTYATFFGGSQSAEHVDGGTSRFDKNGTVYQAVCAGCGGLSDFPSQPGVWSQANPSSNCNLGVFKFRLSSVSALADVDFTAIPLCQNEPAVFTNLSEDANLFLWDFGDNNTSDEFEPSHTYTEPGIYTVTLLAEDSEGCLGPDSTSIEVVVLPAPEVEFDFENNPLCTGEQLTLGATGADSYLWMPADVFINNTLANPIFIGGQTTTISLTGATTCGSQTLEITIIVGAIEVQLEEEILLCPGESTQLNASGGSEYSWSPTTFLDNPSVSNPTVTPDTDITYEVTVSTEQGCEGTASIQVILLEGPPVLSGETDYATCNSTAVELDVSGGVNYSWLPVEGLSNPSISNPTANPSSETVYTVTSTNQCGAASLDILVRTEFIDISLTTDSIGCFLTPIGVSVTGGATTYRWQPENLFADPHAENTSVEILETTEISVIGFNEDGCFDIETRLIRIYPRQPIYLGLDEVIPFGGEATIEAFSNYLITWVDSPYLSCLDCDNPTASPPETSTFYATIETADGCIETDSILVTVTGNMYVPNAFTPDGDGINDLFKAQGIDIIEFRMQIFDRWGELIYISNSIDDGWNGSSPDSDYYAPSGTYPYRIVAREHTGEVFELKGMVTLIR